jgi:hypothetical protein
MGGGQVDRGALEELRLASRSCRDLGAFPELAMAIQGYTEGMEGTGRGKGGGRGGTGRGKRALWEVVPRASGKSTFQG